VRDRQLILAGLGPGDPAYIPTPVLDALKGAERVYLRTSRHPTVALLDQLGIAYLTCDHIYEQSSGYSQVYQEIVTLVLGAFSSSPGNVVYATPGHPLVAEEASHTLMRRARCEGIPLAVLPAPSALEAMYVSLGIDPADGLEIASAYDLPSRPPAGGKNLLVLQLHDRMVASAAKLALMERYPPETTVTLIQSAGVPGREVTEALPLYELDRHPRLDHLTSLFVPAAPVVTSSPGRASAVEALVDTVAHLRRPGGCPWDRQQDHVSLRPFVLEEAYEVVDAIDQKDMHKLGEELGDLLLQVVLHAQISQEKGGFSLEDVIRGLTSKLVRRHPHVFRGSTISTPEAVMEQWEAIKASERPALPHSLMDAIPPGPALLSAKKAQELAARVGFDWAEAGEVLKKLSEEVDELAAAHGQGESSLVEGEIGDVLFSVVNYARHRGVDPEVALQHGVRKFSRRFQYIESQARRSGRSLASMTMQEMDALWEEAKRGGA
jgi:tetrapyrrole methylase family protein/MazG family protein